MKIKKLKKIQILSADFYIEWNKTHDGGSFSWSNTKIEIGIKSIKKDPLYTFQIISHEVMEVILVAMGARFENGRTGENYLFNLDHQTFENAIQIHSAVILKFLI